MRDLIKQTLQSLPKWLREHLLPLLLTIRVGGFLVAALAMWGFATLAEEVLEKESFALDSQILLTLQQLHSPFLDQVMLGLTFLGDPTVLGIASIASAAILLLDKQRSEATVFLIATGGAVVLNLWLKDLFARDRPELWEQIIDVQLYSFPSGHAMISFVVYSMLAYLLRRHFPRWQSMIILGTLLLIVGIGLSRLYLGVHWPTDILAGYAAGLIWLVACIISLEVWKARFAVNS